MLLVGHLWDVRWRKEPVLMYGQFDSFEAFKRFRKREEAKYECRISIHSIKRIK